MKPSIKALSFFILFIISQSYLSAQENTSLVKRCSTDENLELFLLNNPRFKDSIRLSELKLQRWINNNNTSIKVYDFKPPKDRFILKSRDINDRAINGGPICDYNNIYYTTVNSPILLNQIVSPNPNCTFGGEFIRVLNLEAGNTYRISTIGLNNFDTQLTIYTENGTEVVAYNDDSQSSLQSEIYFTPFVTGNYDILVNEYNCLSNSLCASLEIELWYQPRPVITIPVVVHVLHKNEAVGIVSNISDAQILSQIEALNEDFRRMNPEVLNTNPAFKGVSMDTKIEFCLAQQDPNGNATSGINRYSEPTSSDYQQAGIPSDMQYLNIITLNSIIKPITIWNRDNYLNIWIGDLYELPPPNGGGFGAALLGYAQFPNSGASNTDGVAINYNVFGKIGNLFPSYNLGKTTTHEVGHWLNLKHIWGDEDNCATDDSVIDTPLQETATYGCNIFPLLDNCSSDFPGIMFMNFMDYSDDACLSMFTYGQFVRMDATILTTRVSLLSSLGCQPSTLGINDSSTNNQFLVYPNPTNSLIYFDNSKEKFETLEILNSLGQSVLKFSFSNKPNSNIDISKLSVGMYFFKFKNSRAMKIVRIIKSK
jgi:Pregnancy-associated plasma protein-A/Secretion system C-terminal sorting domain